MDYRNLTPTEAEREIERLEYELDRLRDSKTQPDKQQAIEQQLEVLRTRVDPERK